MAKKFDTSSLEKLSPEIRAKVESALQSTLDRELANADPGGNQATHSRSRGAIFSRSRTSDLLNREDLESVVARNIETMNDDAFGKFTERLTALRNLKGNG